MTSGDRLPEIVDYALRLCGSEAGVRTSQRELARRIGLSPGIVGRYAAGEVAFTGLKASTVQQLAEVMHLHVGTLYVWHRQGREAAMDYEHRLSSGSSIAALRPLALAELLVDKLRQQAVLDEQPPEPQVDWPALQATIDGQRQQSVALFERLVELLDAEPVLSRVAQRQPLGDEDWVLLRRLLDADATDFPERFWR